jgi:hypothetical protein
MSLESQVVPFRDSGRVFSGKWKALKRKVKKQSRVSFFAQAAALAGGVRLRNQR